MTIMFNIIVNFIGRVVFFNVKLIFFEIKQEKSGKSATCSKVVSAILFHTEFSLFSSIEDDWLIKTNSILIGEFILILNTDWMGKINWMFVSINHFYKQYTKSFV